MDNLNKVYQDGNNNAIDIVEFITEVNKCVDQLHEKYIRHKPEIDTSSGQDLNGKEIKLIISSLDIKMWRANYSINFKLKDEISGEEVTMGNKSDKPRLNKKKENK